MIVKLEVERATWQFFEVDVWLNGVMKIRNEGVGKNGFLFPYLKAMNLPYGEIVVFHIGTTETEPFGEELLQFIEFCKSQAIARRQRVLGRWRTATRET